jgi:hypothetical protein
MKERLRIFSCLLSLGAITALGQAVALGQTSKPASSSEEMEFQKGELTISPYATYTDQTGGKWGAGAALTYYIQQNIGVGASTYWTDLGGTLFDNFEAEGYFRLPMKKLAPYVVGGIGYQFDRHYWFETIGAGVDFRAFKRIDAFGDIQYRIANSSAINGAFIRLGVRFTL